MNTKILSIAAVAGLLIGSTAMVQAQVRGGASGPGASGASPGHEMQEQGSKGGQGASGFAPGHEMQKQGSKGGPGASGFAPGHQGTTGAGDRDDRKMNQDKRGIDKD